MIAVQVKGHDCICKSAAFFLELSQAVLGVAPSGAILICVLGWVTPPQYAYSAYLSIKGNAITCLKGLLPLLKKVLINLAFYYGSGLL